TYEISTGLDFRRVLFRSSPLLAQHGAAGDINGIVFNALGAKIRGRSKLPHGSRIVCFSPHPDDDVISMGGMLRKLIENGNEIVRSEERRVEEGGGGETGT